MVTVDDRAAYVARMCAWVLWDVAHERVMALYAGFANVVGGRVQRSAVGGSAALRSPLALLAPEELATLLCGRDEEALDLDELRMHTAHAMFPAAADGAAARARACLGDFWDVWRALPPDEQHALLGFITGSRRVPAMGAAAIGLRIHHVADAADRVPWSSTCTSTLFLPAYGSRAVVEARVRVALAHSTGFGLA
ncbi:HECT-type E3 ubiquitin transferase [Malassezia sp. CBS 17886]|nr:HECT-type E3 ubiquitin transferase [Malassezia sp. CBS 17886]